MNIGKTIKRLRREQNMTQEKLADFLNISPQAVSRWENGLAMPELTLVPVIANLFGVSTDLLFGLDSSDISAAIDLIVSKSKSSESSIDKNKTSISVLKEGISRFPSSWRLKNELLVKYYNTYAEYRDELDEGYFSDAIAVAQDLLENCTFDEYRYSAIEILSSIYAITGERAKAIEVIGRYPTNCASGDKLLMAVLDGEEKVAKIKENISFYAEMLCLSLRTLAFSGAYSDEEKVELLEKIERINAALLESEGDRDTELLCNVNRYLAAVCADMGDAEMTLRYLTREADILSALDKGAIVEPSMVRKEYDKGETLRKYSGDAFYFADELLYKAEHERYDFVRGTEGFASFLAKLEKIIGDNE